MRSFFMMININFTTWVPGPSKVKNYLVCRMILAFTLFFAVQNRGSAQTFYVSLRGNDQWSGTIAKPNREQTDGPFATIKAARDAVRNVKKRDTTRKPVHVIIEEGEYYLKEPVVFESEDGGSPSAPVIYRSKGKAVFTGGVQVSNFIEQDGIWTSNLAGILPEGYGFEQLYINGKRATRARTPNHGFFSPAQVKETILEQGTGRVAKSAIQQVYLEPRSADWLRAIAPEEKNNVVLTFYHKWDNTRKYISEIDLKDTAFLIKGNGMKSWNPINAKSQYFVENYKKALDTAGEWYLDDQSRRLYYMPLKGQTLKNTRVFVPLLQHLLVIRGSKEKRVTNLTFENLSFTISGYNLPSSGQEPVQAAAPIEAAIMIDFADGISLNNCEVKNTGASGIWFREACSNSVVEHCYLYDLGAGGVKIGVPSTTSDTTGLTSGILVKNNIIQSGGHVFPCAAGVAIFHGANNVVSHNDIGDLRYTGISVGWIWGYKPSPSVNNIIEYNNVHHLGWGELSDMGGIYTLGPSPGTIIRNNKVHHVYSYTYGGWGIYTDEGSSNIIIENNLVYRTKSAGFHQHYGRENIIRNNIFALGSESQLQLSRAEEHPSFSLTNNIIYYNQGELFKSHAKDHWLNAIVTVDSNCYWNTQNKQVKYYGKDEEAWRQKKRDIHSINADPQFVHIKSYDFRLRNTRAMQQINFHPFDHRLAGVYGHKSWKEKALLAPELTAAFDKLMDTLKNDYSE